MSISPTALEVLEREFLELRAGLLQVAAQLDRLDRARGPVEDQRMRALHQAIQVLGGADPGRAEKIQLIFSRTYDADWKQKLEIKR